MGGKAEEQQFVPHRSFQLRPTRHLCSSTAPQCLRTTMSSGGKSESADRRADPTASGEASVYEEADGSARSSQPESTAGQAGKTTVRDDIEALVQEQRRIRAERKRVAADLKNAQRRQTRLKHRARLLSSEELLKVVALREQEKASKAAKKIAVEPATDSETSVAKGQGLIEKD